jgi:RecB family exonuclease
MSAPGAPARGGGCGSVRRFAPAGPGWAAFWTAAARALAPWLAAPGGAPVAIVVPRGALVGPLQRALRAVLAPPGRAWAPPPIRPLPQWADDLAPAVPVDALARTLGLLQVLDEAMPDSLPGRSPTDRLSFAAGLLDVLDAFAQAGAAGRLADPAWVAAAVEAFGSPAAAERLRDDLALVGRIADALAPSDGDPIAQGIARMKAVGAEWARRGTRVVWLAWQPPEPLEAVLLAELDARLPAPRLLRLEPDWSALGEAAPLLRAAWPERFDGPERPLRERRLRWREAPAGPQPAILHASDREREAQLAAEWVHRQLAGRPGSTPGPASGPAAPAPAARSRGSPSPVASSLPAAPSPAASSPAASSPAAPPPAAPSPAASSPAASSPAASSPAASSPAASSPAASSPAAPPPAAPSPAASSPAAPPRLAIVALDRWLARRVRALLERAGVLIDDREGWLLSTTVAATAAMGWLDAVASDGYYDDLLGWLDSRFVRPPAHRALRDWIERRATRNRYLRGWDGLAGAVEAPAPDGIQLLVEMARQQRRPQPLQAHLARLDVALRWTGATRRLAADAAGRQLLGLLDALRRAAAAPGHARALPFAEFRALLAMVLERHRFFGAIDSPVELLTPIDAAGRDFDAVLVLGASDGALPAPPSPLPLVNEPLRAMLGLPTAATLAGAQQRDLALLLTFATSSAMTCRTDPSDGTRPSPWVERLEAILSDDPMHERLSQPGVVRALLSAPATRPAVALGALPASLPVGGIERLVACPFRFLAQDGWRLREPRQAVDVPGVRERGELVHEILDVFHKAAQARGLVPQAGTRDALRTMLLEATDAVAGRELAAGGGTLGEIAEWRATLDAYLDWAIGDATAGWRWAAGEQDGSATLGWADAGGKPRSLRIDGRLDRLDRGMEGLRIVDYKLGALDRLKRIAAAPDQAAQLVLYAWIASAQGAVAATGYLSLRRDGVRWVPLDAPAEAVLAGWRDRLPAYLARIDDGEPLIASGTECGHCASRGLCRKGHWT